MEVIVGAGIALLSAVIGFFGQPVAEILRGQREQRRVLIERRIETYRTLLQTVQTFDMNLDLPPDHPAREGLPSQVQMVADLMNSSADLFLFGSDKAQRAGDRLITNCISNQNRSPQKAADYSRLRYEFISVVREELGENAVPAGERVPNPFLPRPPESEIQQ